MGTTGTAFTSIPGGVTSTVGSGNVLASGTGTVGYAIGTPNTPTIVLGGAGSCTSNCVAAGTYVYAIIANDIVGHNSGLSNCSSPVTTDGTKTITVSWVSIPGQLTTERFRSSSTCANALSTDGTGVGVSGTSYVDASGYFYSASVPGTNTGASTSLSSAGLATPQITLANSGFSEAFTASPRSEQNLFLPGALTSTWTGATWTADRAVTVTRIQVQAKTAPAGCTTNAIVRLTDGTTPVNVTISAAANDSGVISQNYATGSSLQVLVQTAAAGCTTSPADANVTIQYRMQ
jgi:hypothetical protein